MRLKNNYSLEEMKKVWGKSNKEILQFKDKKTINLKEILLAYGNPDISINLTAHIVTTDDNILNDYSKYKEDNLPFLDGVRKKGNKIIITGQVNKILDFVDYINCDYEIKVHLY